MTPEGASTPENKYADAGNQVAWVAASQEAICKRLKDPDSAAFRDVHFYSGSKIPVACGEVNGRNGFGGYTGYERFIAAGTMDNYAFLESDMTSSAEMDKAWQTFCIHGQSDSV